MAITPQALKTRYPVFANIPDARIASVIEEAEMEVDARVWPVPYLDRGQGLYTAHLLVVEDADSGGVATLQPRRLSSQSFGDSSDSYTNPKDTLEETMYGRRYKRLRDQVVPRAVLV